jgi:CRP-like cAMP-binding protein
MELGRMMPTAEKVRLLRSIGIFSSVDAKHLAEVADRTKEVQLSAGETLFKRGETGTLMYVILKGRMRVHVEDRVLAELGELDVLGEMAALDPEPRSASVTAIENSLLLSLSHHDVRRLIKIDVEVAIGLIRTLCRRLRKVASQAAPASA